jgi:hypothetical protein
MENIERSFSVAQLLTDSRNYFYSAKDKEKLEELKIITDNDFFPGRIERFDENAHFLLAAKVRHHNFILSIPLRDVNCSSGSIPCRG